MAVNAIQEPVKKLKVPKELKKYGNGKLPTSVLAELDSGGTMWGTAAFWWNAMCKEALAQGVKIVSVSEGYRSYARQEALFFDRYSSKKTGRVEVYGYRNS